MKVHRFYRVKCTNNYILPHDAARPAKEKGTISLAELKQQLGF